MTINSDQEVSNKNIPPSNEGLPAKVFLKQTEEYIEKVFTLTENKFFPAHVHQILYSNLNHLKNRLKQIPITKKQNFNIVNKLLLKLKELKANIKRKSEISSSSLLNISNTNNDLNEINQNIINLILDISNNLDDQKINLLIEIFKNSKLSNNVEIIHFFTNKYLSENEKFYNLQQNLFKNHSIEVIFLENDINKLINSIDVIVRYIAKDNQFLNENNIIKQLPITLPDNINGSWDIYTEELCSLQESKISAKGSKQLIIEYLMNLFDPTASIRKSIAIKLYNEDKNVVFFTKRLVRIIKSLQNFGFKEIATDICNQFIIQPNIIPINYIQSEKQLNCKLITKSLKKKEIDYFAQFLKIEIINHILRITNHTEIHDSNFLINKFNKLQISYLHFSQSIKCGVEGIESTKYQSTIIENFLKICASLVIQGEFELSFFLFKHMLIGTQASCSKAWNRVLSKNTNHFNFLEKIINSDEKSLNKFILTRELNNIICIPSLSLAQKEISETKSEIKDLIKDLHSIFLYYFYNKTNFTDNLSNRLEKILTTDFYQEFELNRLYEDLYFKVKNILNENNNNILDAILSTQKKHFLLLQSGLNILDNMNRKLLALQLFYKNIPRSVGLEEFYKEIQRHYID